MKLIVGIIFVCYGLLHITPCDGGAFGIVWTLIAGIITVMSDLTIFIKNDVSTATIHVSDEQQKKILNEL